MKLLLLLGFLAVAYSLNCFQHQQIAYIRVLQPPAACPKEAVACFKVVNHATKLTTRSCSLTTCLKPCDEGIIHYIDLLSVNRNIFQSNGIHTKNELCVKKDDLTLCCCVNNNCNGNFDSWTNITNH